MTPGMLGFPDQADALLEMEMAVARMLEEEHRIRRERERLRDEAFRLRLRLTRDQARRYEELRGGK